MVRRNQIESMFIGILHDSDAKTSTETMKDDAEKIPSPPAWILSDFGEVFRDELPPGLPPRWAIDY